MKVTVADRLGMCFGVRDAIDLALGLAERDRVTVMGQLAHNPEVLARLDRAGVQMVAGLDEPVDTNLVVITAHGASDMRRAALVERGLEVADATCPLVAHAHRMLARLVRQGYFPVVIGRAGHVEVRGLVEDLDRYVVVESEADLPRLAGIPRLGIVSQTTQPPARVARLVEAIRATYPEAEVRWIDTVCAPTRERQEAVRRLAREVEAVVVVGGRNSNNTGELARTCEAEGAAVIRVEHASELRPHWFMGVRHVGVTAGTSTPDSVVDEVRCWLEALEPAGAEVSLVC